MDIIIAVIAMGALFLAVASRIVESDRQEAKRIRILNRTNEKPWIRSNKTFK